MTSKLGVDRSFSSRPGVGPLLVGAATALATLMLAVAVLELWRASLDVPLTQDPTGTFHQALVKLLADDDVVQGPLAAPFGQRLDPLRLDGDRLHLALLQLLARLTGDAASAINVFIVLSFPAVALATLAVLRALGMRWLPAGAAGVLFAFLPIHLAEGISRPLIGAYWAVPLIGYLAITTLRGRAYFGLDGGRSSFWRSSALPLVLLGLAALGGWLYGLVGAVVIAVAALLGARSRAVLVSGLLLAAVLVVLVLVNISPYLTYRVADGEQADVGAPPTELHVPARVDLADLVLPIPNHRLPVLAELRAHHAARDPGPSGVSPLGAVGAVGLLLALGAIVVHVAVPDRRSVVAGHARLGLLALALLLLLGSGGLFAAAASTLPDLDRWTPIGVFIGFVALATIADLGNRWLSLGDGRGTGLRIALHGVVLLVVAIGVTDQTSASDVADYEAIRRAYVQDAALVRQIEEQADPPAMIFQLPVIPIPQSDWVEQLEPYEQLKPYLHSRELRWSAGALVGPSALWQLELAAAPVRMLPLTLAALGFDSLMLHRDGYADGGATIELQISAVLDEGPVISNDRFAVFDLTAYAENVERDYRKESLEELAASVMVPGQLAADEFQPQLELLADGLDLPVGVVEVPDGSGAIGVVQQGGLIRLVDPSGRVRAQPLLDIRSRISMEMWEQGLLGLAFHPDFVDNGRLFVHFTDRRGDVVVEEYVSSVTAVRVDPQSRVELLRVEKPGPYHNGGQLAFGPDGYLYASFGDGVIDFPASGIVGTGQDRNNLLGTIIRIDVDAAGDAHYAIPPDNPFVGRPGRPEIWVYGLRNPWRFSFDLVTNDLYIGDVGRTREEEVDVQVAGSRGGENYGWRVMAGPSCFETACDPEAFVLPLHWYAHDDGRCAITGGYVYRGSWRLLYGKYLFGDFCSGEIWTIDVDNGSETPIEQLDTELLISSFGELSDGEILVVDHAGGAVYRLDPPSAAVPP